MFQPLKILLVGLSLVQLTSCSAATRPVLTDWQACVLSDQQLEPAANETSFPTFKNGSTDQSVLLLSTEWDRQLFRTEYQAGEFLLSLNQPLQEGLTIPIDDKVITKYTEGSIDVNYEIRKFTGTVTIKKIEGNKIILDLDLQGTPSKDLTNRGPLAIKSQINATKISGKTTCR